MDKKILYSYNDNGDVQQYSAYIKLNIKSGFELSEENDREKMISKLEQIYVKSRIFPDTLLCSSSPLPSNRLFFERKDICETLKGNTMLEKFSNPNKILAFLNIIDIRSNKYINDIHTYNERLII